MFLQDESQISRILADKRGKNSLKYFVIGINYGEKMTIKNNIFSVSSDSVHSTRIAQKFL